MNSRNTFIALGIIMAILSLGIAYAAINSQTLNVVGSVTTTTNDANFTVGFVTDSAITYSTANPSVNSNATVSGTYVDASNATMTVAGLTTENQSVSATYTIKNTSVAEINANLSASSTNPSTEWFEITEELGKSSIAPGESTTLTVTVKLKKTPVTTSDINAAKGTFDITVTAAPQANG